MIALLAEGTAYYVVTNPGKYVINEQGVCTNIEKSPELDLYLTKKPTKVQFSRKILGEYTKECIPMMSCVIDDKNVYVMTKTILDSIKKKG